MQRQVLWAIREIRDTFVDVSTDRALQYIQDCHTKLCADFPLFPATRDIPLLQGVQTYSLLSTEISVRSGALFPTLGSAPLEMYRFHAPSQDQNDPLWRDRPASNPEGFAVEGQTLILNSAYANVPVLGYPLLRLHVLLCPDLAQNDLLPEPVKNPQIYVEYACWAWAKRKKPEMAPTYLANLKYETGELARIVRNRNRHQEQYYTPDIASWEGVV